MLKLFVFPQHSQADMSNEATKQCEPWVSWPILIF